jgi:histone deacetylase 11
MQFAQATVTGINPLWIIQQIFCSSTAKDDTSKGNLPIVYDTGYGIGPVGTSALLRKLHLFDITKASKIAAHLQSNGWKLASPGAETTHAELLEVHTPEYLALLENKTSRTTAQIVEVPPLVLFPNWFVNRYVLLPMRKQVAGTLKATELSQEHGWAINLGGGFHHAKPASGEGFCVYGDIQLAVKRYLEAHPNDSVMIVDLDAHRGNGYAQAFIDEPPRVTIFDIYGGNNYPQHDLELCRRINFNYPLQVGRGTKATDENYLGLLKRELPTALASAQPNLIIYNAGTDILSGDRIGAMQVSAEGIVERDEIMFKEALARKTPIVMLLSGGYTQESYKVIIASIDNILKVTGRVALTEDAQ